MLEVKIIKCLSDNYSYLIIDEETKTVGVVDPSEFDPVEKEIKKNFNKLDFILNTHHHNDHTGGNLQLKKKYNAKVICSGHGNSNTPGADKKIFNNQIFMFGKIQFKIIHVPGHTIDHICFFSKKSKTIFTGDSLFSLGCGRVFEGTIEQMFESLKKLKNLPKDTKIYCGHEYTSNNAKFCINFDKNNDLLKKHIIRLKQNEKKNVPSIPSLLSDELNSNIFLRCDDKNIINNLKMRKSSELEVFRKLRALKDQF